MWESLWIEELLPVFHLMICEQNYLVTEGVIKLLPRMVF